MPTEPKDIQTRLVRKILNLPEKEQLTLLSQLESESDPPADLEQRKSERKEYKNAVNFFYGTDSFWGLIQNVSKAGIYIQTDESFEIGWSLTAVLPHPDTGQTIEIPVRVARKDPNGVGVEFIKKAEE
jgi:hypothetical protein